MSFLGPKASLQYSSCDEAPSFIIADPVFMSPTVSVFIVNYNTCALLEQCLKSIFETKDDLSVEVFIADNNSSDGSPDMVKVRFPQVSLMRYSQNVGYTRAMNPLLALAKGDYYLLLHPDLEILPTTLERFLEFFESHPQAGILGGNLYYPDGTPNPCEILFPGFKNDLISLTVRLIKRLRGVRRLVRNSNPLEWSHKSTSEVNWVWNACMILRKEVFEKIGYFDEDFYVWYADWDLCKRAAGVGWSIYYIHSATAIHHERQSFAKEGITKEEVLYKVDGWYSAPRQIRDRYTFMEKHCSAATIFGAKSVSILENALRLWLILGNFLFQKASYREASFQLRACLKTIHSILKA